MYFVTKNPDGSIFRCAPLTGPATTTDLGLRGERTLEVVADDAPEVAEWQKAEAERLAAEEAERQRLAALAEEAAAAEAARAEEQARLAAEAERQAQARQAEREALRAGLEGASTTAKLREAMLALLARLEALEG